MKEMEIAKDHPVYQNLLRYSDPEPELDSAPLDEVPLDDATVLPSENASISAAPIAMVSDAPSATEKEAAS